MVIARCYSYVGVRPSVLRSMGSSGSEHFARVSERAACHPVPLVVYRGLQVYVAPVLY